MGFFGGVSPSITHLLMTSLLRLLGGSWRSSYIAVLLFHLRTYYRWFTSKLNDMQDDSHYNSITGLQHNGFFFLCLCCPGYHIETMCWLVPWYLCHGAVLGRWNTKTRINVVLIKPRLLPPWGVMTVAGPEGWIWLAGPQSAPQSDPPIRHLLSLNKCEIT